MAPFLYTKLQSILVSLLLMIVNKGVMSTKYLWKIDLSDKSVDVILPKDFKFQLSLKLEVRKVTLTVKEMLDFKHDCIKIVRAICQKMLDKSPIKYKICRGITFCDPSPILYVPKGLTLFGKHSPLGTGPQH